ncbi:MAG: rod shape-determining protein MreC [Acidiferrobacter sp.]
MGTFLGWSIKRPSNLTKLILVVCASVALMVADSHDDQGTRVIRNTVLRASYPLQELAALPFSAGYEAFRGLRTNTHLRRDNARLEAENRQLAVEASQAGALRAEVTHMTALLHGAPVPGYRVSLAHVLDVSSGPFSQRLTLDEGAHNHVFLGQAVIDVHGIIGQVVSVGPHTSQVMLITDPDSGIPVVSERNGLRAIAFGTGSQDRLKVPYLTVTADIRPGDILASSGLGGVYPPGYPVARVTEVTSNPNLAFLKIRAVPLARLGYHTHVLLLWPRKASKGQGMRHG